MRVKVKIQDSILTSAVQGRVRNPTDRLTLVNWVVQNQLVNIVEGLLVDIQNVYFYRLRYRTRSTQIEYEVLTVIHQVNFQITLLQHLLVTSVNGSVLGSSPVINSALNESDSIKAMRQ